jgi:hypothetical protein
MPATKSLTKSDEIETLHGFVQSLPRFSYLRSALEPFLVDFERGVYSDYVPSVRESWDARIAADKEASEARAKAQEARNDAEKARREGCLVHAQLQKLVEALREVKVSAEVAERSAKGVASKLSSSL